MPHDHSAFESADVTEPATSGTKKSGNILSAFKEAGHEIAARAKRVVTGKILSAMLVAAAALTAPHAAKAQQLVVVEMTGTVSSGTDSSGSANVFGEGTNLAGQPFDLRLIYNSSKGSVSTSTCSNGTHYYSNIINVGASNPGVALLQIGANGDFFLFGGGQGQNQNGMTSYATQYASCAGYTEAGYGVGASYGGGYSGNAFVGPSSGPSVYPATGATLTTSADWTKVPFSAPNTADTFPFSIAVTFVADGTTFAAAGGYLSPSTLTVTSITLDKNAETNGNPRNTSAPPDPSAPVNPSSPSGTSPSVPYPGPYSPSSTDPYRYGPGAPSGKPRNDPATASPTPGPDPYDRYCGCDGTVGNTGSAFVGEPINVATGNLFESVTDYATAGRNPLTFTRTYNSMGNNVYVAGVELFTYATSMGTNWRSNYDRYLQITGTGVNVERPDGQVVPFTLTGGVYTANTDVSLKLTKSGSTWTLTDNNDTVETYTTMPSGLYAQLNSIQLRDGYTQTMGYNGSNQLTSVTDSYSRSLNLSYSGTLLQSVSTPDSTSISYGYTAAGGSNVLTSVSYPTTPASGFTYQYGNSSFPFALTAALDGSGNTYSSWGYDSQGRATSSQFGGGANATTLAYNSDGSVTVTNALGVADTYTFMTIQGVPKVTQISRAATSTTAAATRNFGYDGNGYLGSATDWNGNVTTYTNNAQGNPTSITEAKGTSVARTTAISYDTTFTHLPHQAVMPGLTSTFAYDTSGNLLSRTDTDTTTNSIPYSTNGQTRITQFTWSGTGEELSVQLPRTDVTAKTTYGYSSDGALTSITDPLSHQTQITSHTGGGRPLTIVDPNSVTSTLTWDGGQRLLTDTVATGAGNLTTTLAYDSAGNVSSVQKPDGSKLTFGHDTAHRLTTITDLNSNSVNYTLDGLGDATAVQVKNSGGTVTQSHTATFDALGRELTSVGGMSQTTTMTYDKNGNALTVKDPLNNTVTMTYDQLNRLKTSADPSPGGTTTITYDAFDRPLTVKDANSNTTSYVYDGFGDRTQTVSPDSGTTVYTYDKDRNLTQVVLAGSLTANMTYDARDRWLTTSYPGDTTLNISNTWDQTTGHGFGIGRLTSATDKVGSLGLTYDERGNITAESRVVTGAGTLNTSTAFDAAGNTSSITYPSGTVVAYGRDSMGRVTSVTAQPPGAGSPSNIATGITYEPFGPVTGVSFGNGITGTYAYDADYRPTTRADAATSNFLNLAYTYDAADNVKTITDSVNSLNGQTLGYDALNRLNSAVSGTGGYGTWSWTWDPVNNVKTQVVNGATTTYVLTSYTNKLSQIQTSSANENVANTATGNINTLTINGVTQETLTYNKANEMSASQTTSSSAAYVYDLEGKRLEKTLPGSYPILYQFKRAGGELLSENDLHSGTTADYIYLNGRPIGEVNPTNGKIYFTHTDRLGTPDTLTDSTKTVVWNAFYRPFGDNGIGGVSGTLGTQSLRLPGQQFDPETGYNHNGFRDYAGTLTRYVQSDPIGLAGGTNTFQYVKGNPFKYTDRSGLAAYTQHSDNGSGTPLLPYTTSAVGNICERVQTTLEWILKGFPEFGANTGPLEKAVEEAGAVGTAVTNNMGGAANAYQLYSGRSATYDPTGDPGGHTTITNVPNPEIPLSGRILIWLGMPKP